MRELKRRVTGAEGDMRAGYTEQRQKVSGKGQVIGMFSSAKTRGAMGRGRAMAKRSLASEQQKVTEGCRGVKSFLDSLVADIDRNKRMIDDEAAEVKAAAGERGASAPSASSMPPPPPTATPAQWAADPHGRHELRYWDGTRWTEHVSNAGITSTDPASSLRRVTQHWWRSFGSSAA